MNHLVMTLTMSFLAALAGCKDRPSEASIRAKNEQAAAVANIVRLGGKVTIDEKSRDKPIFGVDFSETQIGDDDLRIVEGLPDLKALILVHTQVTDAGLKHIEGLTQLQRLLLLDTPITDAGLDHMTMLVHLQYLDLSNTQITDSGLEKIGGLHELHSLSLDDTQITDAGLTHLTQLTHLDRLYTIGTKVTPVGWKQLKHALPKLRGTGDNADQR